MMYLLDGFLRTKRMGWLMVLPLVFVLWCNLHGGFVAGLGILTIFTLFNPAHWRRLVPVTIISGLATLLNPYGWHLWLFLLSSLSRPRPYLHEWHPVRFALAYVDYLALMLMAVLAMLFGGTKRKPWQIALLLVVGMASWKQNRHTVLFGVLAATVAPAGMDAFAGAWFRDLERRLGSCFFLGLYGCLCLIFAYKTVITGKSNPLRIEVSRHDYPVKAVAFMRKNQISGNVFAFFDWSQMVIRELNGHVQVFFDGRFRTVYEDELIEDYFSVLYGEQSHHEFLARFPRTDFMLLHWQNPLDDAIAEDADWQLIYTDHVARLYARRNEHNRRLLDAYMGKRLTMPDISPPHYLSK
jgi:hypothetical protein